MPFDKPRTIKLYVQPPQATHSVTLWPDFKVVAKPVCADPAAPFNGFGLRVLFGSDARMPDWPSTRFDIRPDGIPVHALCAQDDDVTIRMECFCAWGARPVTWIKLSLTNDSVADREVAFGLMPRSGRASLLYGLAPDMYASYQPQLAHWDLLQNTWRSEGSQLIDGERYVALGAIPDLTTHWVQHGPGTQETNGYLECRVPLAGRASCEFVCVLGAGTPPALVSVNEYQAQQAALIAQWRVELAQMTARPNLPDAPMTSMFNSLVCQALQMLATDDAGQVRPRQGGINDGVWPTEAIEYLMAFDRLGLRDAAETGYRYLFHTQVTEGDDRGRVVGLMKWSNDTGASLHGLAYHLTQCGDAALFAQWRERAWLALDWIERRRRETRGDASALGYGLFPAGIGHDWGTRAQYWCFTDAFLYMGVSAMAEAFERFGDPRAAEARAQAEDYGACLRRTLTLVSATEAGKPEAFIPNALGAADTYPPNAVYQADGPTSLIRAGILDPATELFEQVERYFANRGWMQRGLTHKMTESLFTHSPFVSDPWAGHTWYISFTDLVWFRAWLARGERAKAAQTLWAQMRYGMSDEFYMQERYADNDPTFCPWQPNASANGRLIMMLFEFYGTMG
jgi:hypothetical protein